MIWNHNTEQEGYGKDEKSVNVNFRYDIIG